MESWDEPEEVVELISEAEEACKWTLIADSELLDIELERQALFQADNRRLLQEMFHEFMSKDHPELMPKHNSEFMQTQSAYLSEMLITDSGFRLINPGEN